MTDAATRHKTEANGACCGSCSSIRIVRNTNLLRTKCPDYLTKDQSTPNSPNLNWLYIMAGARLETITSVIQS